MAIMTCGRNVIMRNIETNVLMRLHQTVTLPTLLYNAETWATNKSDRKEIDKIELWALKHVWKANNNAYPSRHICNRLNVCISKS